MATWSEVSGSRTILSETVPTATGLVDEHDRLAGQLRRARAEDEEFNREPVAPQIAARMQELERAIAASEWTFTFAGLGRRAYRRLIAEHPPTSEQLAEAKAKDIDLEYDPDHFPPALLAACAQSVTTADDELVEDIDWQQLWDDWSVGQTTRIWNTCLAANAGVAATPKSAAASAVLAASAPS